MEMPVTGVSLFRFVGGFVLNLTVQGFRLFFVGVIVPITPHTQNIKQNCASLVLLNRLVRSMFTLAPHRLTCVLAVFMAETSFRYSTPRTRGDYTQERIKALQ